MAIIQSYPITHNIKASDLLLGVANISSTERPEYITTSFRIGDIAASASTIATSYGQFYYNYVAPPVDIVINAANVWQPTGLVATLDSLSSGFSLGTIDKFALKNISGSTKRVSVAVNLKGTFENNDSFPTIALAINGNIINSSAVAPLSAGVWAINWIVEMQNNDEVSIYVRSSTTLVTYYVKSARMSISQI
jgi:NAD(P)-dependent dehydrogenase (short-subunit alcohol dehydrogenase family)